MVAANTLRFAAESVARDLSVRDLASIIGGRLNLGTMPPLGGDLEPIGRLVTAGQPLRPGDVVIVGIDTEQSKNGDHGVLLASHAFAGGALGVVVAGHCVEPWAGRFSLCVEDAQSLMVSLKRAVAAGRIVPVVTGSVSSLLDLNHLDITS